MIVGGSLEGDQKMDEKGDGGDFSRGLCHRKMKGLRKKKMD